MLRKAESDSKDQFLVLLEYRNTPISNNLASPSEILYGRQINGLLPTKETTSQVNKNLEIRDKLLNRQEIQKYNYDKGSKKLKLLNKGENVFIWDDGKGPWENGKVLSKADRPRSYKIAKIDGRVIERNRRTLLKGPEKIEFHIKRELDAHKYENIQKLMPEVPQNVETHSNEGSPKSDDIQKPVVTRTGRIVRPPAHLKDYIVNA